MTCVLKVDGLYKYYGKRCVVNDVSFQIEEGECFGLLGHNGAGKSTTLECILQVKKADKGSIQLFGKEVKRRDKALFKKIGVQFQESAYPDKMKVDEACQLTASMYQKHTDWEAMLKEFHLDELKHHYINELSGGERQRLSVLLAMLTKGELLFLDELTTGLDAHARRELWQYMLQYKKSGHSMLLTSHYMDEVEQLCDRIAILKEGRIVFIGTNDEIKKQSGCTSLEDAYLWMLGKESL